jgi:phosphopentomutase
MFLEGMREDDVLMITADHGCDPGDESTDHTREQVPLFIYGKDIPAKNLGTIIGFDTIGSTAAALLGVQYGNEAIEEVI